MINNFPPDARPWFSVSMKKSDILYKLNFMLKTVVEDNKEMWVWTLRSAPKKGDIYYSIENLCVVSKVRYRVFLRKLSLQTWLDFLEMNTEKPFIDTSVSLMMAVLHREIFNLISTDQYKSERHIYYQYKNVFRVRENVTEILTSIQLTIGCRRHELHIHSDSKGCVIGDLTYYYNDKKIDCCGGQKIPDVVEKLEQLRISSQVKFILVVEKNTIFFELEKKKFAEKNKCIVVTGKGMPDYSTRAFLHLICENSGLPTFGLFDYNPYGIKIFSVYKYGSAKMVNENRYLIVPCIELIGIKKQDLGKHIRYRDCSYLTDADKGLATRLRKDVMNAEFIDDLKDMVERGFQAQIDSMNNSNAEHMSEIYLPEKLHLFCNPQVRSDHPVKDLAQLNIIKPYHSPVLTRAQPDFCPISLPCVVNPRAGPAKNYLYRILYMPQDLLDEFLKMADDNTTNNLETCGIIAGKLENNVFNISTLIIPKQTSTSDRCETEHEEEISKFVLKNELISLGWIHTHPSQTCFMSSIDLHTQYSYQELIPEAIAIVMCPRIKKHGIFHLSCPVGLKVIGKCDKKDFHDHDIPDDGSCLYEYCSHVELVNDMKCVVVDLR